MEKEMKKLLLTIIACSLVTVTEAQIGYKGQTFSEVGVGIDHLGGAVVEIGFGRYFSAHSIAGIGGTYGRTEYKASGGDSFHATQWVGNIHYRYAIPLNRFILSPAGGILLGGEQCDRLSEQGNIIPYKNRFVYGLFIGCSAEYILGRHLSFYIAPKLDYLMKTNFEEVKLGGNAGVRVYF